jgi:Zn-dependent oligopeptidase
MLENWCWSASPMKEISAHFQSGEPIPDDLLNDLIGDKSRRSKVLDHDQVHFAAFNLAVFAPASETDAKEMDFAELLKEVRYDTTGHVRGSLGVSK